ncbi:MAG: hypothetical protein KJO11_01125 [Gemmatimonadetes bacterium]|nr:hypothetical protein [Gemmatimonadota bacterium]NNF37767.1 hypothetical protein [Gemmatimonadota bacterium]
MTCSEFIESFSDYIDENAPQQVLAAARRHRDACPRCQRYEVVYRRGCSVLSQDSLEVDEHFHGRLQHRLYHVDDEKALARSTAGYHPVVMVLGTAALVAGLVGVPVVLAPDPEVELSPIVVSAPEARPLGLRIPLPSLLPTSLSPAALELEGDDLWHRPADLFYEYAPVRAHYRAASSTRLGLQ